VTYHSPCPFIDNLDKADLVFLLELVITNGILVLLSLDLVGDSVDHLQTLLEFWRDNRLRIRLFDKDKDGEEGDCLLGRVVCKNVFEDKFGKDKFGSRVDLPVSVHPHLLRLHSKCV
jgi:hypothetical protein